MARTTRNQVQNSLHRRHSFPKSPRQPSPNGRSQKMRQRQFQGLQLLLQRRSRGKTQHNQTLSPHQRQNLHNHQSRKGPQKNHQGLLQRLRNLRQNLGI